MIANTETGKPNAAAVQVANGETVKDITPKDEEDKIKKLQEENRKKKDEEEKTKEIKTQDKSRPVSSTPVPGTPWYKTLFIHRSMFSLCVIIGVLCGREMDGSFSIIHHPELPCGNGRMNC